MWIRETLSVLTMDIRGGSRGLVVGYLFLSLLFLGYIYGGKKAFLVGKGYGIPAAVASSPDAARKKLMVLQKKSVANPNNRELKQRLQRTRQRIGQLHVVRMREMRFIRYGAWFFSGFVILFLLPLLFIVLHPRLSPRDFGLGLGQWRFSLKVFILFTGVMLAIVAVLAIFRVKGFLRYYPMYAKGVVGAGKLTIGWFLLLETLYLFYFIGWEFFFRSLILFPLEKKMGSLAALVGVLPFAIMHVGKPVIEAFGSIIAAYFLGVLVLKTRSFWICAILHFFIASSMDLAAVMHRGLV